MATTYKQLLESIRSEIEDRPGKEAIVIQDDIEFLKQYLITKPNYHYSRFLDVDTLTICGHVIRQSKLLVKPLYVVQADKNLFYSFYNSNTQINYQLNTIVLRSNILRSMVYIDNLEDAKMLLVPDVTVFKDVEFKPCEPFTVDVLITFPQAGPNTIQSQDGIDIYANDADRLRLEDTFKTIFVLTEYIGCNAVVSDLWGCDPTTYNNPPVEVAKIMSKQFENSKIPYLFVGSNLPVFKEDRIFNIVDKPISISDIFGKLIDNEVESDDDE